MWWAHKSSPAEKPTKVGFIFCEVNGMNTKTKERKGEIRKEVKFRVSQEEYTFIVRKAAELGISQQHFLRTRALDTSQGVQELRDQIMRSVPRLYHYASQIEDAYLRQSLEKEVARLCRF